jgi:hypothetical protein
MSQHDTHSLRFRAEWEVCEDFVCFIDFCSVFNDDLVLISIKESHFQRFGKFDESDFIWGRGLIFNDIFVFWIREGWSDVMAERKGGDEVTDDATLISSQTTLLSLNRLIIIILSFDRARTRISLKPDEI